MTAVLLASGGLDSTVIAAVYRPAVHLFIDYGQTNLTAERGASCAIAAHYNGEWVTAAIPVFDGASALTGGPGSLGVPVVPGRNGLLIALGIAAAACRGAGEVFIGVNRSDVEAGFPDCSGRFITAANDLGAFYGVRVTAPLWDLRKSQIGVLAGTHGVPVGTTWSCYRGGFEPCGTCGACHARRGALG